jgi:hypothetical protein
MNEGACQRAEGADFTGSFRASDGQSVESASSVVSLRGVSVELGFRFVPCFVVGIVEVVVGLLLVVGLLITGAGPPV